MQESEQPSEEYDEVLDTLEEVTHSFEELSQRKEDVRKGLLERVGRLDEIEAKAQEEIQRLTLNMTGLEQQLTSLGTADSEVLTVRRESISRAIRYVERQVEIWERFIETHNAIDPQVEAISLRIEKLLAIVEGSALVYSEALNLLRLQRDIQEALSVLSGELPELDRLGQEMEQSWGTLDLLVESLLSFAQPGS